MADDVLQSVLSQLRRLTAPEGAGALTDADLLRRVVETRDQAAFEVLVWRHGPLVLGACRKLLGHAQDAEDAFQATFLALARKAASIGRRESLGGWLYQVACRVALRVRSQARRRKKRERHDIDLSAVAVGPEGVAGVDRRDLWAVLIEELHRLPACYREPIVACYLQGKTHADAARELARPVGSMSSLLARGCELLRARLGRRGVCLSTGVLAGMLADRVSAALSPSLVLPAVTAALEFSAGAAVSGPAATLARGVIQGMMLGKVKAAAAVVMVLGVVAGGIAALARQAPTQPAIQAKAPEKGSEPPRHAEEKKARLDLYGDPLPDEAVARLGTMRLRPGTRLGFVRFAPDGRTVVARGESGASTWDVATGKLVRQFPKASAGGNPDGASLSPDGKLLATPGANSLRIWETATGRLLRTIDIDTGRLMTGPLLCACFSPDGKVLASQNGQHLDEVTLWDPASGRKLRTWTTVKDNMVQALAFSTNGKTLVTAATDSTVRFWDVETGKQQRQIALKSLQPKKLAVSQDGTTIAVLATSANGAQGGIGLWDLASGKEVRQFAVPAKEAAKRSWGFECVAFVPGGKTLLAGTGNGTLYICDLAGRKGPQRVWHGSSNLWAVAASPDGKAAAVADDTVLRLIDLTSGKDVISIAGHLDSVYEVAVTPDGRTIVTASGSEVYVWDAASARLQGRQEHINASAIIDGGRKVISRDGSLRVWDLTTQKEVCRFKGSDKYRLLAVAPDEKTIAVECYPATVVVMDLATGKELQRLKGPGDEYGGVVYGAAFTPDGRTLVVRYLKDNLINLWDLATGRKIREYVFPDEEDPPRPKPVAGGHAVYTAAVSPDGRLIAFGSQQRFLELRDLATGAFLNRLDKLPYGVCPMAFSPDCKTLAWAGWWDEPAVHLVEVATCRERHRLLGHAGRVLALTFTADGTRLISGGNDTTALVWDLTGRLRGTEVAGKPLTAAGLEACWADLSGGDAPRAYRAVQKLAASPRNAVSFLRSHVQPAPRVDEKRITRLIADLDNDNFKVREAATKELAAFEDGALALCRKALEGKPSLEGRRRLERVVTKLLGRWGNPSPELVRAVRALEVLERVGTSEAREALEALAKGGPGMRLTDEARAAVQRLKPRAK